MILTPHQPVPHLQVVREYDDLLVINKPPGLSFHQQRPNELGLLQAIRENQKSGHINYTGRLYPVHRLDSVTSGDQPGCAGVTLLAKSSKAAGELISQFRAKTVQKYYVALSARKPKKKQGSVIGDMVRSRRSAWMLLHTRDKPAVTRFWSRGLPELFTGARLYVIKPETGRTHQIRVAMKSLGAPVLGDELYANAVEARLQDRTYLHAAAIRLRLGAQAVEVICAPDCGTYFTSPVFVHAFDNVLGQLDCTDVGATWFADLPLLTSTLAVESSRPDLAGNSAVHDFKQLGDTENSLDGLHEFVDLPE